MPTPFISIVVPAWNDEETIAECIESLLAQNYPKNKYEIIMVDNNSSDRTATIIRNFPVRYILEDRVQSSWAARNRGAKEAKGEILGFTDSDCVPCLDWIKEAINHFEQRDIGCVTGPIFPYNPVTQVEKYLAKKKGIRGLATAHFLPSVRGGNMFFRKAVFNKIGLFDENVVAGDAEFSWRMQLNTDFRIAFTTKAAVSHKDKANISGMFKQQVRYAFGFVNLKEKYKGYFPAQQYSNAKHIFWLSLTIFGHIKKLLCRDRSITNWEDADFEFVELVFEILICFAWVWGTFFGMIGFRHPAFLRIIFS